MTEYPWTPGPWVNHVGRNTLLCEGEITAAGDMQVCDISGYGLLVGRDDAPYDSERTFPEIEAYANASLIALAPEMAEAIMRYVDKTIEEDFSIRVVAEKIMEIIDGR